MRARPLVALIGFALVATVAPASAQDLDAGKSAKELFSSNCSACHQSPHGLVKGGGLGLSGFLRQHYTTSSGSASAIASYLSTLGPDPREAERQRREAEAAKRREQQQKQRQEAAIARRGNSEAAESEERAARRKERDAERREQRQAARPAADDRPAGLTGWPRSRAPEGRGPAEVSSDRAAVTITIEPTSVAGPHAPTMPLASQTPPAAPVQAASAPAPSVAVTVPPTPAAPMPAPGEGAPAPVVAAAPATGEAAPTVPPQAVFSSPLP